VRWWHSTRDEAAAGGTTRRDTPGSLFSLGLLRLRQAILVEVDKPTVEENTTLATSWGRIRDDGVRSGCPIW